MRHFSAFLALLLQVSTPVLAQDRNDLQPVPDIPPPPMVVVDSDLEPQVTIKKRVGETAEEYRVNGKLYKVIIRPDNAPPYTIVDPNGDGSFVRIDTPGSPQLSVPMWVIGTF